MPSEQQSDYPLVSIIVPTYNRPHLLGRTINSLLEQSYKNIEIVLVNDGGVDVKELVDAINIMGVIKYINLSEHKGAGTARNAGLDACTGDYICFLDDDDIFLKYTLEFRMYMMKKLEAEVVYTRALRDIWETKGDKAYVSIHKELYWDCAFNRDLLLVQNIAPICCILFSREAWNKSGNYKFDTGLETGEDYDFWISISRNTDFKELMFVDVEASYRKDKSQATGAKDFSISYPIIYKRWRDTAIDKEHVAETQNAMLRQMGKNPADYGLEA